MSETTRCPACGDAGAEPFLRLPDVPVHVGVLWPDARRARGCARGPMELSFCPGCGSVTNTAFRPDLVDYSLRYDNALHFSATFRAYEEALAQRLVDEYGVRGRQVVEIGCGSGRFLGLLCRLGDNRGTGYDPSFEAERADPLVDERVEVVRDVYSERHAGRVADLVCCRHVLEHLAEPGEFLAGLRRTLDGQPEAVLYLEVPNGLFILRDLSVWDVIYEHCSYFAPAALAGLVRRSGFDVVDVREDYAGQFVGLEARPGAGAPEPGPAEAELQELRRHVAAFGRHVREKRDAWRERLRSLREQGRRVVVWGGGGKAVGFLNLVEADDEVAFVVDINPGKQGTFLAGTGHAIVPPERLRGEPADVVIVMNPVYRDEVERSLRELGCGATTEVA